MRAVWYGLGIAKLGIRLWKKYRRYGVGGLYSELRLQKHVSIVEIHDIYVSIFYIYFATRQRVYWDAQGDNIALCDACT